MVLTMVTSDLADDQDKIRRIYLTQYLQSIKNAKVGVDFHELADINVNPSHSEK